MKWLLLVGLIGCAGGGSGLGDDSGGAGDGGGTGGDGGGSGGGGHGFSCGGLARPWLATGEGPTGIVSGDFDRDGILDLATTNTLDNTVSVFRGLGGGQFAAKVDYPAVGGGLDVADFDGDGKLDLVSGNTVLLGNDDGSFQSERVVYITYGGARFPAAGDFDGDGVPDLLIASFQLSFVKGHGDGTFADPVTYRLTDDETRAIVARDVNGDGKLDVVVDGTAHIDVFLNQGNGTFAGKLTYALDTADIAIGDVTGDGVPDLVTTAGIMPGQGNGAFGDLAAWTGAFDHVALRGAEVIASSSDAVAVYRNGAFAATTYDGADDVRAALVADLDGDGQLDVALASYFAASVGILFAAGDDFIHPARFATASGVAQLALADMNGDGHPDGLALARDAATLSVLTGNGDGSFATKRDAATASYPWGFVLADVDGDGHLDAIADGGGVSLLRGRGDGSLMARHDIIDHTVSELAVADFNSDGTPDLLATDMGAARLLPNAGGGNFGAEVSTGTTLFNPYGNFVFSTPDLDHNGTPDLVAVNVGCESNDLRLLVNNGAGSLTLLYLLHLTACGRSVAYGDFNGDGILDLAVAEGNINGVAGLLQPIEVFLGTGNGNLSAGITYPADAVPRQVIAADVDGDGHLDLLVTGAATELLLNRGDGTFADRTVVGTGATTLAAADLDGDGSLDVVTARGSSLEVLLGTCH